MVDVSIVVPTYNERENIPKLVELLDKYMKNYSYEIVIVDDNSPDGTAQIAEKLAEKYPIRVLKRPGKLGLSSAIYDGIRISRGRVVVVMDADLQHPPDAVPRLVEKTKKCDIVIGSRYVTGGGVENWSFTRRLISIGAILLARTIVPGCSRVKDPVSGFFAVRREILETWGPVEPEGYKVLVEILNRSRNARVCEEPYVFKGREHGVSKLTIKVMLSYVKTLIKLGLKRFAVITALFILVVTVLIILFSS